MNALARPGDSRMRRETLEIPERVWEQNDLHGHDLAVAGRRIRELAPHVLATIARGSSDHAATYLKSVVELGAGVPVCSLSPSVASVYRRPLKLKGSASIVVSQSGASPDLIDASRMTRQGGATAFAIVNAPDAPVIDEHTYRVPIAAGEEKAVAATKSFVGSLTASASLMAHWTGDTALLHSLRGVPEALRSALDKDWTSALDVLAAARSVFVIGRGPMLGVANEIALKLKETCQLHAEGYSAAEVLHGPLQLAAGGLAVFTVVTDDAARESVAVAVRRLASAGANVVVADTRETLCRGEKNVILLPTAPTGSSMLDPVSLVTSFYVFAEHLARVRGQDPDNPSLLAKVTRTQ